MGIKSFPTNIDRDYFGAWFSGFVDGEGSFLLNTRKVRWGAKPLPSFIINLRQDDSRVLELAQAYLSCGRLLRIVPKRSVPRVTNNPLVRFMVDCVLELRDKVAIHFERFPLIAKKKDDFVIWRRGLEVVYMVTKKSSVKPGNRGGHLSHWDETELNKYYDLQDALNQQRVYREVLS